MKPLIMTMSGMRGIVGENLHPQIAMNMAMAFGAFLKSGPVILGGDTRVSYQMMRSAIISGLISVGIDVIDIGQVPTPTVQHLIRYHKAAGGMVITASHNPIMWNGIKLMNRSGSFLDTAEYDQYSDIYQHLDAIKLVNWDRLGKLSYFDRALEIHVDEVLKCVDVSAIQKAHLRVCSDPVNATGALINPILFKKLNVDYDMINAEPTGVFAHPPEPTGSNLDQMREKMASGHYDIGFVQDADADRLVLFNEKGEFIGEDQSLAFGVDYILSTLTDADKRVVVNLSTSKVIEAVASHYGATVYYTKVGESNVTQGLKELKAQVGGEGNGGVIYPKIGWGRDSLVGMVIALKYLAESGKTVSQIVSQYPTFYLLREKIEVSNRDEIQPLLDQALRIFGDQTVNNDDGLKFTFANQNWLHIRPSNTEPIVRIFVEAKTKADAVAIFERLKAY